MDPNLLTPERITIIALLLAIIGAGVREWWVFGWVYKAMKAWYEARIIEVKEEFEKRLAEKDSQLAEERGRSRRWEAIALKALNVGEKAVSVKEKGDE